MFCVSRQQETAMVAGGCMVDAEYAGRFVDIVDIRTGGQSDTTVPAAHN